MKRLCTLNSVLIVSIAFGLLSGCDLLAVKEQQQNIASFCRLYGSIKPEQDNGHKLVVVLLKFNGGEFNDRANWQLFDHFVLDRPGKWYFSTSPGRYLVTVFEDVNGDGNFQPDEPAIPADPKKLLNCTSGEVKTAIDLHLRQDDRFNAKAPVDIVKMQARSTKQQLDISLGQVTKLGDIVTLQDPRFSEEVAKQGLWRPLDFLIAGNAGLYFLEPYSPDKKPVLFVHGINGTPRDFAYVIEHMDRTHCQPWILYYPSGAHLDSIAKRLDQMVQQLQEQYQFKKLAVVAHSMGGLVARNFIFKYLESSRVNAIDLFVTIATPWNGHTAAELAVDHLSHPVYSWEDVVPGSGYLTELFYTSDKPQAPRRKLPQEIAYHLLFTFIDGEGGDGTVKLISELRSEAQEEAMRLYGYQKSHMDVLNSPEVSKTLGMLLENHRE